MNAAGMRFCITCGSPLDPGKLQPAQPAQPVQGSAAPLPLVSPAAPLRAPVGTQPLAAVPHAPAAPVAPIAPIAPIAVVGVAPAAAAKASRICARCRGACEGDAQFCRFCGAPLDGQAAEASPPDEPAKPERLDRTVASPGTPVASEPVTERNDKVKLETTAKIQAYQGDTAPGPRLFLVSKEGTLGPSHGIQEQLDIGRTEGDLLLPDDRYLSARHARIRRDKDGGLLLRDLGTPNGVFLRLRKGSSSEGGQSGEMELRDGDLILIGQQVLRFEIVKDADEGFGAASEHGTLLFGTPAGPRYARLGQVTTEGAVRDVHHLHKAETVLGRESGDIVFTEDPFLSRRHAVLRMRAADRRFTLADLDSSNGTFLRIRGEVPVAHSDEIRIGQQLFRVDTSKGTA